MTNITAVSADAVKEMEERQILDDAASSTDLTGDTIGISGIEYVRVSKNPIQAQKPYYLYQTKNTSAGNPVSMLYKEQLEEAQNFIFGTWAQEYFFSEDAATNAAAFSANEDLYAQLCEDLTVCTKLPVQTAEPVTEETTTQKAEETIVEAPTDSVEEMDSIEETDAVEETEEASGEETETEAAAEEITEETTEETTVETETTTEETKTEAAAEEITEETTEETTVETETTTEETADAP